jgi:hypothetical protein
LGHREFLEKGPVKIGHRSYSPRFSNLVVVPVA